WKRSSFVDAVRLIVPLGTSRTFCLSVAITPVAQCRPVRSERTIARKMDSSVVQPVSLPEVLHPRNTEYCLRMWIAEAVRDTSRRQDAVPLDGGNQVVQVLMKRARLPRFIRALDHDVPAGTGKFKTLLEVRSGQVSRPRAANGDELAPQAVRSDQVE